LSPSITHGNAAVPSDAEAAGFTDALGAGAEAGGAIAGGGKTLALGAALAGGAGGTSTGADATGSAGAGSGATGSGATGGGVADGATDAAVLARGGRGAAAVGVGALVGLAVPVAVAGLVVAEPAGSRGLTPGTAEAVARGVADAGTECAGRALAAGVGRTVVVPARGAVLVAAGALPAD
jgi:hypothetical protein